MSQPSVMSPTRLPVPPSELLGAPAEPAADGWSAPLRIPYLHPFFFDHPLDHVPGMLTVCALLDLAGAAAGDQLDRAGRLGLSLAFPAICGLSRPTVLSVALDRSLAGRWQVRSVQDGVVTCAGWVQPTDGLAGVATGAERADRSSRCRPDLLHRTRLDNVLLGPPTSEPDAVAAALLHPPAGHYLTGFGCNGYSARGLIEAGRQFATMLVHQAVGKPPDTKMIWLAVEADLPCAPVAGVVVALRWQQRPRQHSGSRVRLEFDLVDRSSAAVLGSLAYSGRAISPAAYERFRAITTAASTVESAAGPGAGPDPAPEAGFTARCTPGGDRR
jgi:A-factor biosynthesis hotdog domain